MSDLFEAEQACVGALVHAPDMLALVPRLRARHFADPRHSTVFEAVEWAAAQPGVVPDPVMVIARLQATGRLMGNLTGSYVMDLVSSVPVVANVRWYAQQVLDAARRRALTVMAQQVAQAAQQPLDDELLADRMGELLGDLGELAAPVRVGGDGGRIVGFSTLTEFVDTPDETTSAWVIPGLLRSMERVVVVAPEGSGKTMIARTVACAVAAGRHPFAPDVPIPPLPTLMVDLENPPALIRSKTRPIIDQLRAWGSWDERMAHLWTRPGGVDLRKPADVLLFERVIEACRPRLVCFGPVYKAYVDGANDRAEQSTREVMGVLDRLREKHNFALWVEHHAPLGDSGGVRRFRPFGSSLWLRWPEFGLALPFTEGGNPSCTSLRVERWRGDRDEREWPSQLDRGRRGWPWEATYENGMPDWLRLGMPYEEAS